MRILDLDWGWMPIGTDPVQFIVARRLSKGLTQADLARRVGCARGTIIDLEKNLGGSVAILIAVLSALGLRPVLRSRNQASKPSRVPPRNAPSRDMVMTPPELAAAILSHFESQTVGRILDRRGKVQLIDASGERFWKSMNKSLGSKRRLIPDEGLCCTNLVAVGGPLSPDRLVPRPL